VAARTPAVTSSRRLQRTLLVIAIVYLVLIIGQPAGLDLVRITQDVRTNPSAIFQQLIIGLANGGIIAMTALGYTLVYGIIELVNFAHGDVFMLGAFASLLTLSIFSGTTATGGSQAPLGCDFWLSAGHDLLWAAQCGH
jgi:branched-chain amino acid transport system permease protein